MQQYHQAETLQGGILKYLIFMKQSTRELCAKKIIINWFVKSKIDIAIWSMGTFQSYDGAYGLNNGSLKSLAVSISNRQIHV